MLYIHRIRAVINILNLTKKSVVKNLISVINLTAVGILRVKQLTILCVVCICINMTVSDSW